MAKRSGLYRKEEEQEEEEEAEEQEEAVAVGGREAKLCRWRGLRQSGGEAALRGARNPGRSTCVMLREPSRQRRL